MIFNVKIEKFELGIASDVGRKRISGPNQDSLIALMPSGSIHNPPILLIADGMGGYAGGSLASQMIIRSARMLYKESRIDADFPGFISKVIDRAIEQMRNAGEKDPGLTSMGSTLVSAAIAQDKLRVANVGDSRAYLIHDGEMQQVSFDHSFVGEAVRAGLLTPSEAMVHPKKNQLTQSITSRRAEITPFFAEYPFEKDDVILLCSDGLWGVVSESTIQAVAIELKPQEAAEKLVKLANSRGGPDNISVIILRRKGAIPRNPFLDGEK